MKLDEVTCIVPTHERDSLLVDALWSIANQDAGTPSIVVVDDLDSSHTRETVYEWARDSSVADVRYEGYVGSKARTAGMSRNVGAAIANTEYIAFLDDDDRWDPAFLSRSISALDLEDADMAVAWTTQRRDEVVQEGLHMVPGLKADEVLGSNPGLTGSNFVIRRVAFEAIKGFDATLHVSNDLDFFVRFLDAGLTYVVVDAPLVWQVAHSGGQLTSASEARAQGLKKYLGKYEERMSLVQKRQVRREIASVRRNCAKSRWQAGLYALVQAYYSSPSEFVSSVNRWALRQRSVYHESA